MRYFQNYYLPVAVGALSLVFTGCHEQTSVPPSESLPTVPVSVVKAETREHQAFEEVVGSVQSRQHAEIEAKVNARIEQFLVVPGQRVKAGELLVRLDDREIQARFQQAEAALNQAEGDLKRFTQLRESDTVTQSEFDRVEARQLIATAVKIEAETMLDYTRVLAPFDGVVTHKQAEIGDLASPGRPLVVVENPNALRLNADVPEALMDYVVLGERMNVSVASSVDSIEGIVSEVAPAANPVSRTFLVKLDLPQTAALRLGQFGRVAVPVSRAPVLLVPASTVVLRGQMEMVFVVEEGRANLRLVKTGKHFDDEVQILSGIEEGDLLVSDGLTQLIDGQPVEVR